MMARQQRSAGFIKKIIENTDFHLNVLGRSQIHNEQEEKSGNELNNWFFIGQASQIWEVTTVNTAQK